MAGAHVSMERVLLLAMQRTQHNSMLLLTTIGKADGEYILLYVTSPCARINVHSGTQWRCGPPPQRKNHVRRNVSAGVFDLGTRKAYARKYDLPQPDETRMSEIESDDQGSHRVCLDVCSDFNGFQDCKTRCVPASVSRETAKGERSSSPSSSTTLFSSSEDGAKYHACRSACQVSFGVSCDRAYPMTAPDGQSKFTNCLRSLQDECESLCSKYKKNARKRADKGRL